nr:chromosome partitioning protein ParA [Pseudomonadota bacterium]
LDDTAAMHWRDLPPLAHTPALPDGVTPVGTYIQVPGALQRSVDQIGLVDDVASGERVAPHLLPGQIIVSRDGWAWRWDGFTVTPQAKTTTALRLQQRNRLGPLKDETAYAEAEAHMAAQTLQDATVFFAERQEGDRQARAALQAAYAALADARDAYARQEKESTAITTKLVSVDEGLRAVNGDFEQIRLRASVIEDELKSLPDIENLRSASVEIRTRLAEQRGRQAECQSERDRLTRERNHIEARSATIVQEVGAWNARLENASQQIESLAERMRTIEINLDQLRGRPAELAASHAQLLTELSEAEARRKETQDRLIEAEQRLTAIEQKLKQDEAGLGAAREERVRGEGALQTAGEQFNALRERMQEKLNCGPEELPALTAFGADAMPPALELEQVLARYLRERENIGPVNLRAETEAETLQGQIDALQAEKDDLVAAIAKLRQGIGQLNREAKERLESAFTLVNERFQVLFKRLFNGGRAHLELIDNEDPMLAGLEIFASPPGKKMQILSLLSGGERTLTALALLFAVFQTNPSPICVLDEAEAALDESNIDRFCSLVEDISKETGTRFLIITHQRLTMARMDRLYGVTMSEKGVSQLVSVDLAGAVALRDGELPQSVDRAARALDEVRAA